MGRDYLIRQECPLCGRTENLSTSGKTECFGDSASHEDKSSVSVDVCWWCFYRFQAWYYRTSGYRELEPTPLAMAEFTAHVLKTKPVWFRDQYANHSRFHKTNSPAEVQWRKEQQEAKCIAYITKERIGFAAALRKIPKEIRKYHYDFTVGEEIARTTHMKASEVEAMLSVPGIVQCDCAGDSCGDSDGMGGWTTGKGAGRCITSEYLQGETYRKKRKPKPV
jgi:hypothetical protein